MSKLNPKAIVIGAGLNGLSTAWKLSEAGFDIDIIEKEKFIGGMSATIKHRIKDVDYLVDFGPHKIYSQLPVINKVMSLLKEELLVIPKISRICLKGKFLNPFGIKDLLLNLNPFFSFMCGFDYFIATLKMNLFKTKDTSYESYIINRFGRTTYSAVFGPYARKVWDSPKNLHIGLAKLRIVIPSLWEVIKRMVFGDKNKQEISASMFHYPKNGIIRISDKILDIIKNNNGKIHLNSYPTLISLKNNKVVSLNYKDENGKKKLITKLDNVVATIPLRELVRLIKPAPPKEVIKAADLLRNKSLIMLYVILKKPRLFKDNWIFFPEKEYIFNRISEQKGFSKYMIPDDKTVLMVEITCDQNGSLWKADNSKIFNLAMKDLKKVKLVQDPDVHGYFTEKIINAYPIYDLDYKQNLNILNNYFDKIENLITNGRQGLFNYGGMIDVIDMGINAAEFIKSGESKKEWAVIRKRFENYVTVD